jgi:Flp pilus assembly protein TadG
MPIAKERPPLTIRYARRRAAAQDGVVLVLVSIMLLVILAASALAIDLGSFYKAQRQAQAAADAAALAASQDLPSSTTAAASDGTTYATTNDPGAAVTVTPDYNSTTNEVKVTVTATTPSFFGQLLGLTKETVSASAVAGSGGSSVDSAVFAADTNCGDKGVTINGSGISIPGGVHSNGYFWDNGSSISLGTVTYGGPNGCGKTVNGSGDTFTSGPTVDPKTETWPHDYSGMSFPSPPAPNCTGAVIGSNMSWSSGQNVPGPNTYCSTSNGITFAGNNTIQSGSTFIAESGSINIGSNVTASNCTIIAENGDINITGSNVTLTNCVLESQTGKVVISGSTITDSGNVYANGQNGVISVGGSSISLDGILEATASSGQINFNATGVTGYATLYGGAFQLNGSGIDLKPYPGENNLLAYQTGTQTLTINGSGYLDTGTIFAPNASIEFNGSGVNNPDGFMEGQTVTINGTGYTLTGNGPPLGGAATESLIS